MLHDRFQSVFFIMMNWIGKGYL